MIHYSVAQERRMKGILVLMSKTGVRELFLIIKLNLSFQQRTINCPKVFNVGACS